MYAWIFGKHKIPDPCEKDLQIMDEKITASHTIFREIMTEEDGWQCNTIKMHKMLQIEIHTNYICRIEVKAD